MFCPSGYNLTAIIANGQDTILTERQWLQVRTSNFKAWFEDWENDPENSCELPKPKGFRLLASQANTCTIECHQKIHNPSKV